MKPPLMLTVALAAASLTVSGCASSNQGYAIESGFFVNYPEAQTRAAEIQSLLGDARVEGDLIHYQPVYRVYSGTYAAPRDADGDLSKLRKAGIEAKMVEK